MQTAGWLGGGLDAEAAARAALARNVEVTPLARYGHGPVARNGLLLGFAAVDAAELRRGTEDLAAALAALTVPSPRRGARARTAPGE